MARSNWPVGRAGVRCRCGGAVGPWSNELGGVVLRCEKCGSLVARMLGIAEEDESEILAFDLDFDPAILTHRQPPGIM